MSRTQKFATILAGAAACAVVGAGSATAAPTAITHNWKQIGACVHMSYPGAQTCFYYDANNALYAMGKLINESDDDISNQGAFVKSDNTNVKCGSVITKSGATASCIRKLPSHGSWVLIDVYTYGSITLRTKSPAHTF